MSNQLKWLAHASFGSIILSSLNSPYDFIINNYADGTHAHLLCENLVSKKPALYPYNSISAPSIEALLEYAEYCHREIDIANANYMKPTIVRYPLAWEFTPASADKQASLVSLVDDNDYYCIEMLANGAVSLSYSDDDTESIVYYESLYDALKFAVARNIGVMVDREPCPF